MTSHAPYYSVIAGLQQVDSLLSEQSTLCDKTNFTTIVLQAGCLICRKYQGSRQMKDTVNQLFKHNTDKMLISVLDEEHLSSVVHRLS